MNNFRQKSKSKGSETDSRCTAPDTPLFLDPLKIKLKREIPGVIKAVPGGMIVINILEYHNPVYRNRLHFFHPWDSKRCDVGHCDAVVMVNVMLIPGETLYANDDSGMWYQARFVNAGLFSSCDCDNKLVNHKSLTRRSNPLQIVAEESVALQRNGDVRSVGDTLVDMNTGEIINQNDVPF